MLSRKKMSEMFMNKIILAPMVRVGTLPVRMLSLDYGADLVYCEEIIDRKILSTTRTENDALGTVDFTLSDGTVVFRTCQQERDRVIFQLGSCDARRALAAAQKVEKDVAGIDLNMGCPKEFSIKGGMGCALLKQPEKIKQILTTLVNGLSVPVTCKIRVFAELDETLKLVKLIEGTGVAALAVHGRTREERPQHKNRNHVIKAIAETLTIPVIANGGSKEIFEFQDIERFRLETGASSVMIARQAEWNCSIFRKEGKLPVYDVIKAFLKYAFRYNNNDINTKYCVLQMMHEDMDKPEGQASLTVKTNKEMSVVWGVQEEYHDITEDQRKHAADKKLNLDTSQGFKRRRATDGQPLIELPVHFEKKYYMPAMSPKQSLHEWCKKNSYGKPVYITEEHSTDRSFHSSVLIEGKWYTTPFWEKSKQLAEQGSAVCCLLCLGIDDGRIGKPDDHNPELHRKWRDLASQVECNQVHLEIDVSDSFDSINHEKLQGKDVLEDGHAAWSRQDISDLTRKESKVTGKDFESVKEVKNMSAVMCNGKQICTAVVDMPSVGQNSDCIK